MLPPAHLFIALFFGTISMLALDRVTLEGFFIVCVGGLLPDFDYIVYFLRKEGFNHEISHHTWITHTPIPFWSFAVVILFLDYPLFSFLFFIGTTIHLLLDCIGGGDGIMWLYPFSRHQFGILILNKIGGEWLQEYWSYWYFRWIEILSVIFSTFLILWFLCYVVF